MFEDESTSTKGDQAEALSLSSSANEEKKPRLAICEGDLALDDHVAAEADQHDLSIHDLEQALEEQPDEESTEVVGEWFGINQNMNNRKHTQVLELCIQKTASHRLLASIASSSMLCILLCHVTILSCD